MKNVSIALLSVLIISCGRSPVEKGEICLRLGDYPGAISFFDTALEDNPADYAARVGMGKALLQRSVAGNRDTADWRRALVHLEAARSLLPSGNLDGLLAEAWTRRAHMLLSARDTIPALEALTRAIERDPRAVAPLNLAGIVSFRMGHAERARALFSKAVEIDSANAQARFNLGMVFWHENEIARAHAQWLDALNRAPEDPDILYWFARAEKELRE